jgi:ATP-dependent helicase HrpB
VSRPPLPVDPILPDLVEALRSRGRAVLEAPPGAGKTTRVPPAIAEAFPAIGGVWVLEPRRLAARTAARRVAEERRVTLGQAVGYRVRFDDKTSAATRIVFATEGVLLERLRREPELPGVGVVVFDEFHERHLDGDLILGLCRRLAERRSLLLCVMSATLDAAPIAEYLGAPRLRSEGRRFPVEIRWAPPDRDQPLERAVAAAARACLAEAPGDVLCFLPGAREIRAAERALGERVGDVDVVPLHGDLPPEAQDRAIRPGPRRKIILSTNVAETSVTIEGVNAVVDSGLARVASHSPWTGLPTLMVRRISRSSAAQRAGRAGRLGPGRCVRLYAAHDHDARPEHDLPEVVRADLAAARLLFAVEGLDPATFPWLTPPPEVALRAAEALLERLGAIDAHGVTALGRRLAGLPLHPRVARLLLAAAERGAAIGGAAVAALIADGQGSLGRGRRAADVDGAADVLEELERLRAVSVRDRVDFDRARHEGLDLGRVAEIDRARKQLERLAPSGATAVAMGSRAEDEALLRAILAAFPDRVARRQRPQGTALIFSEGGNGKLDPQSVVRSELLVAYDVGERGAAGGVGGRDAAAGVVVRGAARLEPDWLLEAELHRIVDERIYEWNRTSERVDEVRRMRYGAVLIEETRTPARVGGAAEDDAAIARCLGEALEQAMRAGGGGLAELRQALVRTLDRVAFLAGALPELALPAIPDLDRDAEEDRAGLRAILASASAGSARFSGLVALSARDLVAAWLPAVAPRLDRDAPEFVQLGARRARIEYPRGQAPHVASRLQDFFGMAEGPRVAAGRVALTLHLLAPNQRAVQVTSDLGGFWARDYPRVRRELGRRYPRHRWPENPLEPGSVVS